MLNEKFTKKYSDSHALIVGINKYKHASPLSYAVNDAQSVANLLIESFNFKKEKVIILDDTKATRKTIIETFLSYTKSSNPDDRIIFFFAGHGYTLSGRRGDVGFLIPYDGDPQIVSTLIRWDELTGNAELIPAKHIFFMMDACYSGLAITRSMSPGSMRFLEDMLIRYSRQVITAGKANEVVADSGGPIPDHSVFTGHLIEGLEGKASSADGIITANGLMAYVYEKVARDQHSHQTPHYGFIDGDGDLIFKAPILGTIRKEGEKDEDILVTVPSSMPMTNTNESPSLIELTKEYLSDSRYTIKLHDVVIKELRKVLLQTSEDNFTIQGNWSLEEFTRRINEYERIISDLQHILCCIAYWGNKEHLPLLKMVPSRLTDRLESKSGLIVWQSLRWYPAMVLFYSAGISAIAAEKYENLATILLTEVKPSAYEESKALTLSIFKEISSLHDAFKSLPGHERQYVPRSEYLFKLLQPMLDDLLFLGRDYERDFDRLELFFALVFMDLQNPDIDNPKYFSAPIGRFSWKSNDQENTPLSELLTEANMQKELWPPLKAGLFRGDYTRFKKISDLLKQFISRLNFW